MLERAFINRLAPTAYVLPGLEERRIESNGAPETAEALASLAWKGLLKRASDRQRSVVRQLVRARIAHESLDQLEQRRSLGWASSHDPAPILIGQHRQVLHGLHVSPTHQRLLRERNADLFSRARFGLEQTATIVCQLPRASHRVRAEGQARDKSQPDHRQSASHPLKHAGCRGPRAAAASGDASALWMEFPASTRRSQGALRVSREHVLADGARPGLLVRQAMAEAGGTRCPGNFLI